MRRIIGVISVFSVMEAFWILLSLWLWAQAAWGNSTDASCFTLSDWVITDYNAGDTKCWTDIVIPSTINWITIKEIWNNAFSDKGITSVSIPNSVEKIWSKAFSSNNIKNLVLPDSITTVWYAAFMWNKGLGKIKLSKNMEYIPADFCDWCDIKELEWWIPNGIKRIWTTAFYSRGSQEYEGGYTVWTNPTFRNMEKITIPESVTNIYWGWLWSTWFDTYEIYSNDITFDRVTTNYGQDVIFKLAKWAKVKYNLTNVPWFDTSRFWSKTYVSISNLEEDWVAVNFIIPREQAGTRVEYQPIGIGLERSTKVSYPSDIELTWFTIEWWYKDTEFNEKFDINSETVEENLTLYGKLNPKPCWEFTVIDEENKEVEVKKFNILYPHCQDEYNKKYETNSFTIPTSVPSGLEYAWYKVTWIWDMAFCDEIYRNWMGLVKESFVSKIIIPNTIKYIGNGSFRKSGLEYLELPDSIESIWDTAFFDSVRLTGIKWSENLRSIGSNAFAFSTRLTKTKFPDSLKYIWYAAFHESGISEIEFWTWSQLDTVWGLAFGYTDYYNWPQYWKIKKITFPKSLKSIDNRAFYNNKVEEVTLLCDSCTVYQDAFKVEGRSDRQIPWYKRRNADIKNYDLHLVLTDIVETYKITLDSDWATEKGTENLWYDLWTPIYYLDKEKQNTIDGGITIPTKEWYSFQWYFTEKNWNGLKYISNLWAIGKIYNIDSDTVLYASWKKDEEQDNTHNAASSDCNWLSNPKREGYKFIWWYTDKNYTKIYNPNELVTWELTLYSKWEEESNSRTPSFDDSDDSDDHQSTGLEIPEENYWEISALKISWSDDENNLWDNLENSNDKDNENKSVKYTVKHLTETLTWAYTLLSTETPTAESWSKVTPPVKKFKGYKSPNTKTITVKWDWTSVVEYRYSRELFEIILNKWEWIQTVAWGGSYRFWTKVSLSATPVPGYEFVGFEGDQTTWSFTMPSNNITITAKAKKGNTKYSISYNLNKWKLEQWKTNPTSYSSSSPSFTINPPVRNEYVFAWWEETVNWKVTWTKTYVSIPQWSTWHRKYSAKWKKEWEVEEMIYNQQEDLEGNYVTVEVIASDWDWDSDSWNWNANWPREYEWFHLVEDFSKQNSIDQWAIWEVLELWSNWPATIIYRYARNSYTLTIEKDAWIESVQWAWTYKYQEPVSIKVKVKDWYQFAWFEWEYNVANFEMPAKNLTIKATTTKNK